MVKNETNVMEDKRILKEAIRSREMTQIRLAEKLGVTQTALSANMLRDRMSVDTFRSVLSALGYDVAVIDRESGEVKWVVDPDR